VYSLDVAKCICTTDSWWQQSSNPTSSCMLVECKKP
jgi:hypothetical protein